MEQNIQQNAENKLPLKTKIAAWLLLIPSAILSFISLVFAIVLLIMGVFPDFFSSDLWPGVWSSLIFILIFNLPIFLSIIFIFKKRKIAWLFLVIILIIEIIIYVNYLYSIPYFPIFLLIVLALLLLDRKNFWLVAK